MADVNIASEPGRPPQALLATTVSTEFFRVLGAHVSVGRPFGATEHLPGGPRVALLSHQLWQRRYGADPQIIGRTIDLSTPDYLGEPGGGHVVIGVLAPETWLFWRRSDPRSRSVPIRSSCPTHANGSWNTSSPASGPGRRSHPRASTHPHWSTD